MFNEKWLCIVQTEKCFRTEIDFINNYGYSVKILYKGEYIEQFKTILFNSLPSQNIIFLNVYGGEIFSYNELEDNSILFLYASDIPHNSSTEYWIESVKVLDDILNNDKKNT